MSETYPSTQAGLVRYLTVNGTDLMLQPENPIQVSRSFLGSSFDGLSRRTLVARYAGAGHPDRPDRYEFDVPYGTITDHADRTYLEKLRAIGGFMTFAYWRSIFLRYTATAGQTMFYLPRCRKNAATALSLGDVTTDTYPVHVWINDVAKTVDYYSGTVTSGDTVLAGHVRVGSAYDSTGNLPFKVGDTLAAGDVVLFEWYPLFQVEMTDDRTTITGPGIEDRSYHFVEI